MIRLPSSACPSLFQLAADGHDGSDGRQRRKGVAAAAALASPGIVIGDTRAGTSGSTAARCRNCLRLIEVTMGFCAWNSHHAFSSVAARMHYGTGTSSIRVSVALSIFPRVNTAAGSTRPQPRRGEVAVVRARRVARLSGGVHGARVVPVADVDHHAERRAVLLPEVAGAVRRLVRRVGAAALRHRADVESDCASLSSTAAAKGCAR